MRRSIAVALLCAFVSCTSAGGSTVVPTPDATPLASPTASAPEKTHAFPKFGARVPRDPKDAAAAIADVHRRLPRLIGEWLNRTGALRSPRATEIRRGALWAQRLYRALAKRVRFSRRVLARLHGRFDRIARRHISAQRKLTSLVTPVKPPVKWKTYRPESPHALRRYYRTGERRYDVPWFVLAAVNAVESRFGRILGPSSAGAMGPMQFIPSTWEAYGGGGDIMDAHDSIIAAARYLNASGAPERMRDALYAYNRSYEYVDAILTYAREIARDERNYYMYYFWEVFVQTTKGDLQLTGPGGSRRPR